MSVTSQAMAWAADLVSRSTVPVGELPEDGIPAGYREVRVGEDRIFWPPADPALPVVGLSPIFEEGGKASELLAAHLPDWRSSSAWQPSSAGSTLSGWRFETSRGDFLRQGLDGTSYISALVMVLSGTARPRLLWALGNPARAILDGEPLLRVLHGLPLAEASGSEAQLVVGTWRLAAGSGIAQYAFFADGSFETGTSLSLALGSLERTTSSVHGGRYTVADGVLELADADGEGRFRGRVFDEMGYGAETPLRQLGLLPVDPGPEVIYALVAA